MRVKQPHCLDVIYCLFGYVTGNNLRHHFQQGVVPALSVTAVDPVITVAAGAVGAPLLEQDVHRRYTSGTGTGVNANYRATIIFR